METAIPPPGMKILIVEDDPDLVETYTDLLESHGYTVISVMRASEALPIITRQKPAVIILDMNLPGESGSIVINFVRGYISVADTKIIVATGHPEIINKSRYIAARADAILTKPVSNQHLLATIHNLFAPAQS